MAQPLPAETIDAARLLAALRDGNLDAAIEAGLMRWDADCGPGLADADLALVRDARSQLQAAWAARERYRARAARLDRIAQARDARRTRPPAIAAIRPPLPPAAASALARARAKASRTP